MQGVFTASGIGPEDDSVTLFYRDSWDTRDGVKNYIITSLEQYEGNCKSGTACSNKIQAYIKQVGYSAPDFHLEDDYICNYGYCYKEFKVSKETGDAVSESKEQVYYRVVTQINIDIPIINKIMPGLKIFQISGNTKLITPFK